MLLLTSGCFQRCDPYDPGPRAQSHAAIVLPMVNAFGRAAIRFLVRAHGVCVPGGARAGWLRANVSITIMRPPQQGQRGLVSVGAAVSALSVPPQSASGSGAASKARARMRFAL